MSFSEIPASHTDDKAFDFSVQGCEELTTDFFDEFLTFNNEGETYAGLPQYYGEASTTESTSVGTSMSLTDDEYKQSTFTKGELGPSPFLSSSQSQFYNDLMGRAAISDTELLSLEGISLETPSIPQPSQRSLQSSPTPTAQAATRRKARMVEAISKSFKKATSSIDKALLRSPIRKSTSLPRKLSTPRPTFSSTTWEPKTEEEDTTFDFQFNENSRNLTPPLTCRISDISPNPNRIVSKTHNAFTNPPVLHRATTSSAAYNTPLGTPVLEHGHSRNSSGQFPSSGPSYPVTPRSQQASSSWGQLAGSPPLNNFSRHPHRYLDVDEPLLWGHASTKMAQPSPSGYHTNPQRATKSLAMQLQNGLAYSSQENMAFDSAVMASGLMIQMPGNHPHSLGMGSPSMQQRPRGYYQPSPSARPQPYRRATRPSYVPVPPPQNRQHSSQHYRPPYHKATRKTHQLSSDSDSSSPKSPTFHVRKRRSPNKSTKRSASAPRTPSSAGPVDFVNFTPQDSKKILTGVAPSGSSKTKARREKEAMEKRRKLSQAAVRAVRAAGGDIESLVEEGLFV